MSEAPLETYIRTIRKSELVPGRVTTVVVEGRQIALAAVDDEVVAFEDSCPHAGSSFAAGRIIGGRLICPLHGAKFDPRTGLCVSAPYSPLTKFATRLVDGFVEVGLGSPT